MAARGLDLKSVELAAKLRRELDHAGTEYERATAEYKRLMNVSRDVFRLDDPVIADGSYAIRQALRIHRSARLQYERALRNFTDYILYGKLPLEVVDRSQPDGDAGPK